MITTVNSLLVAATLVAPGFRYSEGLLSKITPAGWLAQACQVQKAGLTGHPEALSYPYDTCLWAGAIPRMGTHGSGWWRYEQTAYYVDGLLRLGYALNDRALIAKGEANVDYVLEHQHPQGYLGDACLWQDAKGGYVTWPMSVFFRAMKAKYDATGDARIPQALERYYLCYDVATYAEERNLLSLEGMLWTYGKTKNAKLLELAEKSWLAAHPSKGSVNGLNPANCSDDEPIYSHAVTYCEDLKIPLLLAAATGKAAYLAQAKRAEAKLVKFHLLADGCPESTEFTRGNSVHWGHETCNIADYTWSLGSFVEVTGEAVYADRLERAVLNAGFGAVKKDFTSLQYFSALNQFLSTSTSDPNLHRYGSTWMQFRPTHETECCAGNVHRILPNYLARMWMTDSAGDPVAVLYGPCTVEFPWGRIVEETTYPAGETIRFRFALKEPRRLGFSFRVPGWCTGATVSLNGRAANLATPAGAFARLAADFKDGDVVEVRLPMTLKFERLPPRLYVVREAEGDRTYWKWAKDLPAEGLTVTDRETWKTCTFPRRTGDSQGTVVSRGPLLFAKALAANCVEDSVQYANMNGKKSANPAFKCWTMTPAEPFGYALAGQTAKVIETPDGNWLDRRRPAVAIEVPVRRIAWELENGMTGEVPEKPVCLSDKTESLRLVPYGATELRLTVFPEVGK